MQITCLLDFRVHNSHFDKERDWFGNSLYIGIYIWNVYMYLFLVLFPVFWALQLYKLMLTYLKFIFLCFKNTCVIIQTRKENL
jgi:hypothetical protein